MNEMDRLRRNAERLKECHPWFRGRVHDLILDLEHVGLRPRIQCAWRSPAAQEAAVTLGNSQVLYGYHNVTEPDGARSSFAVDLLDDNNPLDPPKSYPLQLAWYAERRGLVTLIRWGLSPDERAALDSAIRMRHWNADVRIGKDPCHVQPGVGAGFAIDQLREGWRPPASSSGVAPKNDTPRAVAPDLGTGDSASEPPPTMSEGIQLSTILGPLPTPHECGDYGYQLEADMKRLDQTPGGLSALGQDMQERLRNGVPRWIVDAATMRMKRVSGDPSTFERTFRQKWYAVRDVQEKLEWWGNQL